MKNTTSPNRKLGRMLAKNLIVLAVVVLAAIVGSMSWFTQTGKTTQANGVYVECKSPEGYKVAIVKKGSPQPSADAVFTQGSLKGQSVWREGTLELTKETYPDIFNDLYLTDIDGDGYNFFIPKLKQVDGRAIPVTTKEDGSFETWQKAEPNVHYLSVDVYVRADNNSPIYLAKESTIKPNSTLVEGVFNKDAVVGAVRMAIVSNASKSANMVWIPAPNVNYDSDKATIRTNLTAGDTYTHFLYSWNTSSGLLKSANRISLAASKVKTNNDGSYSMPSSYKFCDMPGTLSGTTEYLGKATCNLWIEGEDDEARLATVGGQFKVNLVLTNKNN